MIIIKNISKEYPSKTGITKALNDVTLQLEDGIHALLGPNGAGKSTLMKLLTCNIRADKGAVFWNDTNNPIDIIGADYRALLGYAPQQQGLYEAFTGYRFLKYMAVLKDIPKDLMDAEIEQTAASVNLTDVLYNRISSYSGGMKQRLLIAQSLLGNPRILILDEPTVGLDPNERVRIREYIKEVSENKIVLIATHIVSDIETIADDVIIMKHGNIVEKDTIHNLCRKYDVHSLEDVYVKIFSQKELEAE